MRWAAVACTVVVSGGCAEAAAQSPARPVDTLPLIAIHDATAQVTTRMAIPQWICLHCSRGRRPGVPPLLIVDGVALPWTLRPGERNPLVDLDPDDIESAYILKNPVMIALFGRRAAYGVVLIRTRDGAGSTR